MCLPFKLFYIMRLCLFYVHNVYTPAYHGLRVHDSQLGPNQTLVSYTVAGLA
jgi:hypothetical protein